MALPKGLKQVFAIKDIVALISGGVKGIISKEREKIEDPQEKKLWIGWLSKFLP